MMTTDNKTKEKAEDMPLARFVDCTGRRWLVIESASGTLTLRAVDGERLVVNREMIEPYLF